jgi:hypothetical protein
VFPEGGIFFWWQAGAITSTVQTHRLLCTRFGRSGQL